MPAPVPRMHGLTHVPGGPDPIPGLTLSGGAVSFPAAVFALAATRDLRGYWRLGEGASPFADTSGHAYGAADAVKTATGTAMTDSITGALSAADDDGAVQFNNTTGAAGDYLHASDPVPRRFNFNSGDSPMTVAAWVSPTASSSTFIGMVTGVWADAGFGPCGWRLAVSWPTRAPVFVRRESGTPAAFAEVTGPALAAGQWAFVVATYDATNGHRLYVDGALANTDATTFTTLPSFNTGPVIGSNSPTALSFCGGIDEVTVWGGALTADEVATLYTSGVGGTTAGVGTTWYHGSGTPDAGLGGDGDYYLDTAAGDIWFRAAGAWTKIWDEP